MKYLAVVGEECVACGACVKVCPRQAIHVIAGCKADVNDVQCVGCGLCVNTCPAGIIEKIERITYAEEKTLV